MGVELICLEDERLTYQANWWTWRPIVARIAAWGIFPDSAIELLSGNSFAEFEEHEARLIGERLAAECLDSLSAGERMRLDGTTTAAPDTGELFRDDLAENYSTPYAHLAAFVAFCRTCKGFRVE